MMTGILYDGVLNPLWIDGKGWAGVILFNKH